MKQFLFSKIAITGYIEDTSLLNKNLTGQLKVDFLIKGAATTKVYEKMFTPILKTIFSKTKIFFKKLTRVLL